MKKILEYNLERPVQNLATLCNKIYVGYDNLVGAFIRPFSGNEIDIYDIKGDKLSLFSSIYAQQVGRFNDLTSCNQHNCIYIADYWPKYFVHRIDNSGNMIKWSIDDEPAGLSVNSSFNVLVTYLRVSKVKEYTTDGQLKREINLQPDIVHPWHTIQLSPDRFVVSHGFTADPLNRVCIVDRDGAVVRSYGGKPGSSPGQLSRPMRLAEMDNFIFVVDRNNCRVLMLSSNLTLIRDILSGLSYQPCTIWIEKETGQMILTGREKVSIYTIPNWPRWLPRQLKAGLIT